MREKLTVLITCKNERANIGPCLDSIRPLADEILVADSGSTDGTLDYLRRQTDVRLIAREYVDAGNFKNWAIPQAVHPWLLIVDADERATPALVEEIRQLLSSEPAHDGYWVYRRNYFFGNPVRYSGWGRDKVIRLFRRDAGRYHERTDHSEVQIGSGRLGVLKERLIHFTCENYDQFFIKMHRYTQQQADLWFREGRRPSVWRLAAHGPLRFLRSYVVQRGFLDGLVGFQVAALTGFYSFQKQARLWANWQQFESTAACEDGDRTNPIVGT